MAFSRYGKEPIIIYVSPRTKRVLEIRKKRTGDDFGDQLRPFIRALVEDSERLFGHLPEFKELDNKK